MTNQPTHPDNLLNRVSRIHIEDKTFKNDAGQSVDYSRLILSYSLRGRSKTMELAIKGDKIDLLESADIIDGSPLNTDAQ